MPGKVYLVGAGPGDPELLTLKGRRVLAEADVVIYDRLANPRLLEHTPPGAERIYVGKEARSHAAPQEAINALLIEHARAGKVVCRLKGGDPFIYGRGGEEALALQAAGIPWEYVPGISSFIAAPGYAGIPVTHRGLCTTFAVVTAHEDPLRPGGSVDWAAVSRLDTIVFMMGVERLPGIVARLREHGKPADTPVAVVSWGTWPRQQTVAGTLADIEGRAAEAGLGPPAVTVVGAVAGLRERLRWWDARPLFGRRVVVTRPRGQAAGLVERLEAAGAEALCHPTIRIERLERPPLAGLERPYDWAVFTSANGVDSFVTALREAGKDIRALGPARIAAIGPETARAAEEAGLRVDFVPTRFVAEAVLEEFPEAVAGRRVLIPRALEARELLPERWRAAGAEVDVLPVYRTVRDKEGIEALRDRLARGEVDALTFTASSTVRHFAELLPGTNLERVTVACIGPITEQTAREAGLPVHVVAREHTAAGLVAALEAHFAEAGGVP